MNSIAAHFESLGMTPADAASRAALFVELETALACRFSTALPQWRRFTPGRIEIFGKHTDYAGGHSLLAAVPRGITLAARSATDGIVRVGDIFDGQVIEVDPSTAGAARTIAACSATCTSSRTASSSTFPAASSAPTSRSPAICRAPPD